MTKWLQFGPKSVIIVVDSANYFLYILLKNLQFDMIISDPLTGQSV